MCGICGYISEKKSQTTTLKKSLHLLSKRGPDKQSYMSLNNEESSILFGHTRLAIIDLNPTGNQPMSDESGDYTIVFNGEIYNYLSIRPELIKKGHTFRSTGDTEVLLKGYKTYGRDIVKKIEGMFAFAIYDKKKNSLFLARDHFGKKPLYYYQDESIFAFASELKALLVHPAIKKRLTIDESSIEKFLLYGYIPSPHSIYREIKKLEPSSCMEFDLDKWKIQNHTRYWKLEDVALNRDISLEDGVKKVDSLLHKAVKKRLLADVPVGSFLSGGIDSSLVTTLASQYSPGIETFTVTYSDKKFDESIYAKEVGDTLKIKYNFLPFNESKVKPLLHEMIEYMDEPMADASLLPTTFVSSMTRKKVTVALSGDGGDELFGGYSKYSAQLVAESIHGIPAISSILTSLSKHSFLSEEKKMAYSKYFSTLPLPDYARHFILGSGSFTFSELQSILRRKQISLDDVFTDSKAYANDFRQKDFGNKLLYLDAKIQLPDWYLVKADRAAMSQSLEVRSPFLDKELAELSFSLPSNYKFSRTQNKIILKQVAERYLPKGIINRRKMGFGLPLNLWMKSIFKNEIVDVLKFLPNDILNKSIVEKFVKEFFDYGVDHGTKIWRLYILANFFKKYE